MEKQQWFLVHNNAPAHQSILVKNYLARNNVTTLEHPRFSTDLAPIGFYPFHQLKSVLKERRFCGATNIIKNATEELKRLSQNGFQECFEDRYSSWQIYIAAHGAILKEMWLKCVYSFVFIRNKMMPGTF